MFDLKSVPKWDPGVVEARQVNEGPLERVGTRIQTLGKGGVDRGTVEIAEFELGRKLGLRFLVPEKSRVKQARLTYTFEPMESDETVLSRLIEIELKVFSKLLQPLVSSRVEKDSKQEAANIEALFRSKA